MNIRFRTGIAGVLVAALLAGGCDNYFDCGTDDLLEIPDSYEETESVHAGLIGLASLFREVVEHHIVLSELMGDLMQPTENAPDACWDVYRFKATDGNEFATPEPYYRLVVNCNEFIKHVIRFNREYPGTLADNVYRGLISTALTYRAWSYLQIGKIYGEAVYHDLSFVDNNGTVPGDEKVLKLDDLVEELIYNMKFGVDGVNAFNTLDWKTVISPINDNFDQVWNHLAVEPNVLLTELYLWDKDYTNAAVTALNYLGGTGNSYKMNVWQNQSWQNLFGAGNITNDRLREAITLVPFDFDRRQTSSLMYYFSDESPNVYYFKGHQRAVQRFRSQALGMSKPTDPDEVPVLRRGTDVNRLGGTFRTTDSKNVVVKYSRGLKSYEQDAPVFVYRAPEVYLMICEALSGLGGSNNISAADTILNVGMRSCWVNGHFTQPFEAPIYGSTFNVCPGIRSRVNVKPDYIIYHVDTLAYPDSTDAQKLVRLQREKFVLDSLICEETALELAFEGKRWFTLMRIARNSEHPELLAKQVSAKFDGGENEVYERWLMDPENWFIRWDHRKAVKDEQN